MASGAEPDVRSSAPLPKPLRALAQVEHLIVIVVIGAMTLLPTIEILTRIVFRTGIPGSLLYTQHLTLWVAFLGALLAAAGTGKHMALHTGEFISAPKVRRVARVFVAAFNAGVCALIGYASVLVVRADAVQPRYLPGNFPEWVGEMVMPVALFLMMLRFLWGAGDGWRERLAAALTSGAVGVVFILFASAARTLILPGAIAMLVGLALGAPIFVAMAGVAMLLFFADGTPIAALPTETFRLVASSTLPAIPLLTVAGCILAAGGSPKRLLRLARAVGGWMPGGMAVMVCFVCAGFTAFTGGSGVTILAIGGLVLPMLIADRYPEGFSLGLVTCSGSLGLLLPPSLPVILYAVVAQASIEELFIAGFLPGLLLILVVAIFGVVIGQRSKAKRQRFAWRELGQALWLAKWEAAIPVVVLLTVFSGYATIVEAAAVAVVCAIVSQALVFRDLHLVRDLPRVIVEATALVGAVLILLGMAMGLTSYLVEAEIPTALLAWARVHIESPVLFLLILNAALLVLGSVLEIYSAIVILAPLLTPLASAYGIDPLHLGIVFLANLELGFLLPPMGLNLILASTRFGQPLARLYRVTLPFLLVRVAGLLLVTYVPQMTTGMVDWLRPRSQIGKQDSRQP